MWSKDTSPRIWKVHGSKHLCVQIRWASSGSLFESRCETDGGNVCGFSLEAGHEGPLAVSNDVGLGSGRHRRAAWSPFMHLRLQLQVAREAHRCRSVWAVSRRLPSKRHAPLWKSFIRLSLPHAFFCRGVLSRRWDFEVRIAGRSLVQSCLVTACRSLRQACFVIRRG